jgi:hypothetical protein
MNAVIARLLTVALAALCAAALAGTTIDASRYAAYGANVGWLNARGDVEHGAVIGQSFCTGSLWSANCGWIGLGMGPTNGWRYGNAAGADWGVNHDGEGRLSGYAYGANIGWITFEQTRGCPRVDLRSGVLSGFAWGANVGWISLSNASAYVQTTALSTGPDADADGIPDAWERQRAGGLTELSGGHHDADGDGVSDADEYAADTSPLSAAERFHIYSFAAGGGAVEVSWFCRPTRLYRVVSSGGLGGGAWQQEGALIGPPSTTVTSVALPAGSATSCFYRVQARLPLTP